MIDLTSKKIYLGAQSIERAYLGERLIHGQSLIVQPVDYTGSVIAINVQNEKMNEYVDAPPNSHRILITDDVLASATGLTPTISNNCIVLNKQAIIVKTGFGAVVRDFYAEITFKTSTLLAKQYACFFSNARNGNYFKVESVVPKTNYRYTFSSETAQAQPIPETEYVTFSLASDSAGSRFYVNGNLTNYSVKTTYISEYVFFGAGLSYQGRVGTTFDRIDIVDIKWGNTSPSEAQIVSNYQNIQQRLQTI